MLECSVCLQAFGDSVVPVSLTCGHIFCESDLLRMGHSLEGGPKCPTCRKPFMPGRWVRLYFSESSSPSTNGSSSSGSNTSPAVESLTESERQEAFILSERIRSAMDEGPENSGRVLQEALRWAQRIQGAESRAVVGEMVASWQMMMSDRPRNEPHGRPDRVVFNDEDLGDYHPVVADPFEPTWDDDHLSSMTNAMSLNPTLHPGPPLDFGTYNWTPPTAHISSSRRRRSTRNHRSSRHEVRFADIPHETVRRGSDPPAIPRLAEIFTYMPESHRSSWPNIRT
ncbi:hypothetical protein BD410DRAFT_321071 [Rickenella mellea]|uniref:RING-type domain-containing protein n=1 Tax=Rickenella mellea TaxID=50990 RepID=A0A4Y7Q187_9AGAM|nr:hypothetical protein BD410DRAFT_321071 [Rickenella mellea]